jgi:starch phosphorylase
MNTAAAFAPSEHYAPTVEALLERFQHHLKFTQVRDRETATVQDHFMSLALAVRDLIAERMIATQSTYRHQGVKCVYYLSLEYLLGGLLRNNLVNLGLLEPARAALGRLGVDVDALCDYEPDAGLGNGGLGRLAACFMDSLATLQYPGYGYGIRYEYGIFTQDIHDGWQVERPDDWLRVGWPWEIPRHDYATPVRLYGHVEHQWSPRGEYKPVWRSGRQVMGIPYDIPIVGYGCDTVNFLRLWSARASESFDLAAFNRGGYVEAVREKALNETMSKVLYPDDRHEAGRELRLVQQYFFVACTLADILRRYDRSHDRIDHLPDKVAIQLNDTHPALGIAELMRILVDERGVPWERAWEITQAVFAYTNHTLLPEALEVWPVWLLERVVPRHLQIIYEINRRFLEEVQRRWPGDARRLERLSLVQEGPQRGIRMAHLAIVGSHHVNGVAALHTHLIRTRLVPDFAELWPARFSNKTNGVTPRRWLAVCNPALAAAITEHIGGGWVRDLEQLRRLEPLADEEAFRERIRAVKQENKRRLAEWARRRLGIALPTDALFDVQVKRLHEYKRQLLNLLHVIVRYQRLRDDPRADVPPRVVLFGAKAAPGYGRAKLIIKLIHEVARTINSDPRLRGRLGVWFLPDYRVSLAERIIPAADLSEQISTAGMEASGTGNMKFAMNGALTIGTLDGANIEIRAAVGPENFFLFGLTAEEVESRRASYDPWQVYHSDPVVRRALDALRSGELCPHEPELFRPVFDWLTAEGDRYMLLADLPSYLEAQQCVDLAWGDPSAWTRSAILNIARIGYFSSDRAIREYARDIWRIHPTPVDLARAPLPP